MASSVEVEPAMDVKRAGARPSCPAISNLDIENANTTSTPISNDDEPAAGEEVGTSASSRTRCRRGAPGVRQHEDEEEETEGDGVLLDEELMDATGADLSEAEDQPAEHRPRQALDASEPRSRRGP